jgi:DNA-binding phage protein
MKELRTWTEYLIERFAADKEEAMGFLYAVMEEYQIYGNPAAVVGALHTVIASQGGISEFAKKTDIEPQVLSEILSSNEPLRIDTLRTILNAFGCRLSIEPANNNLKDASTVSEEPADLAYELDEHRASTD